VLKNILISASNPSICSEHAHMKCTQETELLVICQKAVQYNWKVKVIFFRYSLQWVLFSHDTDCADRLNTSKSFNNMHYAASDKEQ